MIDIAEILSLIHLKQEGSYWDFKRQWYESGHEGDLLHDIICMANNLVDRDAYLIIGVDEERDYSLNDISLDPQRRTTQMLVGFLRSKKFAGDYRPVVTVEPVRIDALCIDVIVIHNSSNTPFFLKESYRGIHEGNIYVRLQDTNTPINETADLQHVETLWKKRFGMLRTPLERMKLYLEKKAEWDSAPGYDNIKYYRLAPEFTIGYSINDPEERDGYEFYLLNQTDNTPHWTNIQLKYHQTLLIELTGIFLDGGRHFSPAPEMDGVSLNRYGSWDIAYRYWVKDSLEYVIHQFFLDEESHEALWSERLFMENILVFDSEDEHQLFNWYVENYWYDKEKYADGIREPYVEEIPGYNVQVFKDQIKDTAILQKMLEAFRKEDS